MTTYFDSPCAACQHRRGSHREVSTQWGAQACMVPGCSCTAWRAA
jgi:hypothetical protein